MLFINLFGETFGAGNVATAIREDVVTYPLMDTHAYNLFAFCFHMFGGVNEISQPIPCNDCKGHTHR